MFGGKIRNGFVVGGMVILLFSLGINLAVYAASFDSKTALRFDGSNDMVLVTDDGTLDFAGGFTVEAWIKPYSLGSGMGYKDIVGGFASAEDPSPAYWHIYLKNTDYSQWGFSVCTEGPGCNAAQSASGALVVDTWTHLAGVFTDDATIKIYQNGQFVTETAHFGSVSAVNYMKIGLWETAFNGWIDEVRIWNYARSPQEIQAGLYHLLTGTDAGLVAYYRFDEGSGQVIHDRSNSGLDGQLGYSLQGDVRDPIFETGLAPLFYVMDQYFVTTDYGYYLDDDFYRCQEIRPSVSPLAAVEFYIYINGNPGNLVFSLRNAADQELQQITPLIGTVPGIHWMMVNLTETELLIPGEKYKLCLSTDQNYSVSDGYAWYGHMTSTYPCADCSANVPITDFDFNFRTLALPVDPVYLPIIFR